MLKNILKKKKHVTELLVKMLKKDRCPRSKINGINATTTIEGARHTELHSKVEEGEAERKREK